MKQIVLKCLEYFWRAFGGNCYTEIINAISCPQYKFSIKVFCISSKQELKKKLVKNCKFSRFLHKN